MNIPIVVAAFDREHSLERLLKSLNRACYSAKVKLVISIDGGGPPEVVDLANQFEWEHGEKEVISHKKNLGLRKHILSCGRLTQKYDGIILLEDDLFVSYHFYDYVLRTQEFYSDDDDIAGVSLYSHKYNETACLPFVPIDDGYDVYFMQWACSWGQSWLTHQWEGFEQFYRKNHKLDLSKDTSIPPDVRIWPEVSWKKYFLKYMIQKNKYFVYPRVSYTTNFGDAGQNHQGTSKFMVPIQYGRFDLKIPEFNNSGSRYDSYCEMIPECLEIYLPDLKKYDYEVDLYGLKHKNVIKSKYVLTKQECNGFIKSYGCKVKPHEANIIEDIPGESIFFTQKSNLSKFENYLKYRLLMYSDPMAVHPFFYSITHSHYYYFTEMIRILSNNKIDHTNVGDQELLKEDKPLHLAVRILNYPGKLLAKYLED